MREKMPSMDPVTAAKQAAARHGVLLTDQAAQDITDAALDAHNTRAFVTQHVYAEAWENEDYREHLRSSLLRELLAKTVEQGTVPVELPIMTTRIAPEQTFYASEMVEVAMTVRVRTLNAEPAEVQAVFGP